MEVRPKIYRGPNVANHSSHSTFARTKAQMFMLPKPQFFTILNYRFSVHPKSIFPFTQSWRIHLLPVYPSTHVRMGSTSVETQTLTSSTPELQSITAQNVQRLFPGSVDYLAESKEEANRNVEKDLQGQGHQEKQVKAMEEVCISTRRKRHAHRWGEQIHLYDTFCLIPQLGFLSER